jgi:AAA family ATP:ADP antiporter
LSLVFMRRVILWQRAQGVAAGVRAEDTDRALGGSMFAAFPQVVRSPYLLGIALFVFLVSWVSTFLYLEQLAYVARIFATRDQSTRFFARVDFWVQAVSLVAQLFVFARLFKWVGFRVMLVSVPILMTAGYASLPWFPCSRYWSGCSPCGAWASTRSRGRVATRCSRS